MHKKRFGMLILLVVMLFAVVFAFGLNTSRHAYAVSNGLAVTPPMGWNDWNRYGCGISDSLIRQQADAMVNNGLKAAGYQYINIDDCWETNRNSSGGLVADHSKWGVVGLSQIGALTEVDILVTDDGLDGSAQAALSDLVGELIIARRDGGRDGP